LKTTVRVQRLSKKYFIGRKRGISFRDSVNFQNLFSGKKEETFWALKDISFEVRQGEVLGIIGKNGAGKSTLLKILSRITQPTEGRAEIHGRIASLLEVGTGFHPELTGRENIFLNGAILGMKQLEIKNKLAAIVDFSGIERFIDTPVKHYSSGMYVRLAFAVAAHLEPEILIVDEVLAVGDTEFQKKCLGKMKDVSEHDGRTVLFVSHNMSAIRSLCSLALLLENGKINYLGSPETATKSYFRPLPPFRKQLDLESLKRERGKGDVIFGRMIFNLDHYYPESEFMIQIKLKIRCRPEFQTVNMSAHIVDEFDYQVYHLNNLFLRSEVSLSERTWYCFKLKSLNLKPGNYKIWLWLSTGNIEQDYLTEGISFQVTDGNIYGYPVSKTVSGIVQPEFQFDVLK
jgi:lipopolysaccharide transport system ATP-binding protein